MTGLPLDPAEHADDAAFPSEYGELRARGSMGTAEAIRASGGRTAWLDIDLADAAAPATLFESAEAVLGPVDILVNNASGWRANTFLPDSVDRLGRTLRPVDAASHDRQFAVDVRASALLIAEFARRHRSRGANWGRIIGLTSGGADGFPQEVSYGAAKAALESYTKSAALELAPFGVTANLVHPPVTDTGWITPANSEVLLAESPFRSIARPEEVAEVVLFLSSRQARFVTGQVIRMA